MERVVAVVLLTTTLHAQPRALTTGSPCQGHSCFRGGLLGVSDRSCHESGRLDTRLMHVMIVVVPQLRVRRLVGQRFSPANEFAAADGSVITPIRPRDARAPIHPGDVAYMVQQPRSTEALVHPGGITRIRDCTGRDGGTAIIKCYQCTLVTTTVFDRRRRGKSFCVSLRWESTSDTDSSRHHRRGQFGIPYDFGPILPWPHIRWGACCTIFPKPQVAAMAERFEGLALIHLLSHPSALLPLLLRSLYPGPVVLWRSHRPPLRRIIFNLAKGRGESQRGPLRRCVRDWVDIIVWRASLPVLVG